MTVCHSKTHDLPGVCRRADILVAAIGRAGMITREFVKPGATVIDVGMNTVTDPAEFRRFFAGNAKREEAFRKKGSTLIGDVHPEVAEVAGAITPGTGWSGAADDRHADVQHGEGGENAPWDSSSGIITRLKCDFTTETQRHRENIRDVFSLCLCVSVVNGLSCGIPC